MNIITRVKNNFLYAHYRIISIKALKKASKHTKDADPTIWRYWAKKANKALKNV